MSNNPYVNITKVVDSSSGVQRPVDFINQKKVNNVSITFSSASWVATPGAADGEYYQDFTIPGLRNTHAAMVILPTSATLYLDKSNFTTCYTTSDAKLRLYWNLPIITGSSLTISTIILFETYNTAPIRGILNGGGGGSAEWTYDAADVDVFIEYMQELGANIATFSSQIQETIDGFGSYFSSNVISGNAIQAQTIDATRLTVHGPNILNNFDSFEQFFGKSLLGPSSNMSTYEVTNLAKYHGDNSLKLVSSGISAHKYINPYTSDPENWVRMRDPGDYIFSFYVKTASNTPINGSVELYDILGSNSIANVPFNGLIDTAGWVRYYLKFTVAAATEATIKINIAASGVTLYLDALQLEKAISPAHLSPSPFSAGGTTVISGDTITTGTINASNVSVINLNASNITAGTINAAVIGVTDLNASNITTGSLNAGRIAANTITSDMIVANTITADKQIIADSAITNAMILNLDAAKINTGSINTSQVSIAEFDSEGNLTHGLLMNGATISLGQILDESNVPFYSVEVGRINYESGGSQIVEYGLLVRDADSTQILNPDGLTALGVTRSLSAYSQDPPATGILTGAAVMADGTLNGAALLVNSVYGESIMANAITARTIDAAAINAVHISAGTITVDKVVPGFGNTIDISGNLNITTLDNVASNVTTHFSFGSNLSIRNSDATAQINLGVVDNKATITLKDGTGEVATIQGGTMSIGTANITTSITIGQHKITKYEISPGSFITIFQQI